MAFHAVYIISRCDLITSFDIEFVRDFALSLGTYYTRKYLDRDAESVMLLIRSRYLLSAMVEMCTGVHVVVYMCWK